MGAAHSVFHAWKGRITIWLFTDSNDVVILLCVCVSQDLCDYTEIKV